MQEIWKLGLKNLPTDKVKVLLVPCYLEGNDGIFNMAYYHLLAANDLALYPSYYEPWGYTPRKLRFSHALRDYRPESGFGQWVDNVLGHSGELKDGVCVIHRTDGNFYEVAQKNVPLYTKCFCSLQKKRTEVRNKAAKLANKAQWKHFIKFYYQAYDFALNAVANA